MEAIGIRDRIKVVTRKGTLGS